VVVVTHRPEPEGWDPEAPFHFVDGVEAAVAKAQELAGDRIVDVAAGEVGGYFGSVHAQHRLEDPDVAIQGNRVLPLRYRVRR
jgi:hypothetical protein